MEFITRLFDPEIIPWSSWPSIVSFVINLVVVYGWVRKRIHVEEFTAGAWQGELCPDLVDPQSCKSHRIKCTLLVVKMPGDSVGYMNYERFDILADKKILMFGLDKLTKYETYWNFFWNRKWEPEFTRCFHKFADGTEDAKQVAFRYQCRVTKFWFGKGKMEFETTLVGGEKWKGILERV